MIKKITSTIDGLSEWAAKTARWIVLVMVVVICYDVSMRYFYDRPTIWAYDISYMLGGSFFMLGLAYLHSLDKHVRVDVIYGMCKPKTKALIDIVMSLIIFFPTFTILILRMTPHVITSWQRGEKAVLSFWTPPIYPLKTVVLIGVILLWLQGVSNLLKSFEVYLGEETGEVGK